MSRFNSTISSLNVVDASRSSVSSLDPALSTLSPEDAEILEEIVAKVPEATTFMSVFKSYSEVLQQRGLDPGNDVLYYKQLLKLGVVKGSNWGAKWETVKRHLGLVTNRQVAPRPVERILPSELSGLTSHDDVFTIHSHADETETAVDQHQVVDRRLRRTVQAAESTDTDTDLVNFPHGTSLHIPYPRSQPTTTRQRSTVSPTRNPIAPTSSDDFQLSREVPVRSSTPLVRRGYSREPPESGSVGRERVVSVINDAEAWKKVDEERRIEVADRFRRRSLLSMCFNIWKIGLDWIITTHTQIDTARDHILLKVMLGLWRKRNAKIREVSDRAKQVARFRTRSTFFNYWREKALRARHAAWRQEMKERLYKVRLARDGTILEIAWTKWRHLYQARQLYAQQLQTRTLRRWREKLQNLVVLEYLGDDVEEIHERRMLENVMETWRRRLRLRDAERYIDEKFSRRMLARALDAWISAAQDSHDARVQYDSHLLKRAFGAWKDAKARMHALHNRSDKHLRRRESLLLRAVLRVWVARERGQLLERVRSARLMQDGVAVWKERFQKQKNMEESASAFAQRRSAALLFSALRTWNLRYSARKKAQLLSEQHYAATLMSRTLLVWRLQLRANIRMARGAKMARTYFLEKKAWTKWRFAVMQNRRKRVLQQLERQKLKDTFSSWLEASRRKRYQARAIFLLQESARKRMLRTVLQHWTNRVINLKLREIDTVERYEVQCVAWAFARWRERRYHHVENLSLVHSFLDVKREETLRRTLLKWLIEARKSRTRRIRLAEREDELRQETLRAAWEIWRDRFRENMLQDIELQVILQNQTNVIYDAFMTWQSRSKTLPAIRFHSKNLKSSFWKRWRAAMPQAMEARKAREFDTRSVLTSMFKKWSEAYRTKITTKAIARARYLRLPSPGGWAAAVPGDTRLRRPLLQRPVRGRTALAERRVAGTEDDGEEARGRGTRRRSLLRPGRPASRAGTIGATAEEAETGAWWTARSPQAPADPAGGDEDRRERLWKELRGRSVEDGRRKAQSR